MFTGLVQARGRVVSIEARGPASRLRIDPGGWDHRPAAGDSISVSGCCLTVAGPVEADGVWPFDVVSETLSKTTLGVLRAGDEVNLEHSCRADTLMGGHIVQGHVEGVARVSAVSAESGDWRVEFEPPAELMPFMVPKGSVTVDGVSLTIARVSERSFGVALIPTTLQKTTMGALRTGGHVNIETDVIVRTVVHYLRAYRP